MGVYTIRPMHRLPLCSGGHFTHVSIVPLTEAASAFLLVEMNKNPLSSLSVTSGKNYGRGRILFVQVHLGIDYDTQGNLHLPKPIFHGSDPCSLSLNFYKSVQISGKKSTFCYCYSSFRNLKSQTWVLRITFHRYFLSNWR